MAERNAMGVRQPPHQSQVAANHCCVDWVHHFALLEVGHRRAQVDVASCVQVNSCVVIPIMQCLAEARCQPIAGQADLHEASTGSRAALGAAFLPEGFWDHLGWPMDDAGMADADAAVAAVRRPSQQRELVPTNEANRVVGIPKHLGLCHGLSDFEGLLLGDGGIVYHTALQFGNIVLFDSLLVGVDGGDPQVGGWVATNGPLERASFADAFGRCADVDGLLRSRVAKDLLADRPVLVELLELGDALGLFRQLLVVHGGVGRHLAVAPDLRRVRGTVLHKMLLVDGDDLGFGGLQKDLPAHAGFHFRFRQDGPDGAVVQVRRGELGRDHQGRGVVVLRNMVVARWCSCCNEATFSARIELLARIDFVVRADVAAGVVEAAAIFVGVAVVVVIVVIAEFVLVVVVLLVFLLHALFVTEGSVVFDVLQHVCVLFLVGAFAEFFRYVRGARCRQRCDASREHGFRQTQAAMAVRRSRASVPWGVNRVPAAGQRRRRTSSIVPAAGVRRRADADVESAVVVASMRRGWVRRWASGHMHGTGTHRNGEIAIAVQLDGVRGGRGHGVLAGGIQRCLCGVHPGRQGRRCGASLLAAVVGGG
mmetsp:Transcript_19631/g.55424  ORF Transcript_19631/g.55424 Transcript_19631/m.55424 type:complete len:594 (-) Transcript_19631:1090-2871(-)